MELKLSYANFMHTMFKISAVQRKISRWIYTYNFSK